MFVPIGSNSGESYQTQRSLRFRASASAYLSRTFGAATDRKKSTLSIWVKRGAFARGVIFSSYLSGTDRAFLEFDSSDRLNFDDFSAGQSTLKTSTRVFRDQTAWLHIVLATDTDAASDEDRVILWVNNERITSWVNNTKPGLSINPGINGPRAHYFGQTGASSAYADMYDADAYFVDGKALTPSAFGEFDTTAPTYWKPKSPAQVRAAVAVGGGTRNGFGTNGCYEPFSDPTSLTTLMYDRSQSDTDTTGNNWTANNISLTAGATYDSMLDVPLGSGGQERGNYATLNPLARHAYMATAYDGNLTANNGGSQAGSLNLSGTQVATYPVYMELTAFNRTGILNGAGQCGFQRAGLSYSAGGYTGSASGSFGFGIASGSNLWFKRKDGATASTISLAGCVTGTVMQIAFNPLTGEAWVGKDGTWNGSGNPSTGANPDLTGITDSLALVAGVTVYNDGSNAVSWYVNFGQRPFAHAVPTGFRGQHTGNLTDITPIASGSFTGSLSAYGPFIWCNGTPDTLTINGNAVTWGTHADKLANGFKLRTSSSSYNSSGTNTWTATYLSPSSKSAFKYQNAKGNP